MKKILLLLTLFGLWRLLLFIPLWYSNAHIPMASHSMMYTLWAYARPYPPVSSYFWYPWTNFDGVHYLTIAADGGYRLAADGRFFPLYPVFIWLGTVLLGGGAKFNISEFFSALIVSNAFFAASLIFLYKLIRLDYSKKVAWTTLGLLLCFPISFFFGAVYTESLYLFLSIAIFYCLRTNRIFWAVIASLFLLLTRVVGITILPILLYVLFKEEIIILYKKNKKIDWRAFSEKAFLSIFVLCGLGVFAFLNYYYWGDWLYFIHAQEHVVNGRSASIILFPQTIFRYIKILLSVSRSSFTWWISLLELSSFLFALWLLVVGYLKKIHPLYLIYAIISLLIPTQSGTFTGLPRYVMVLFPLFLSMALIDNKWIKLIYAVIGLIAMFFLLAFFSRGYYVA